MDPKEMKRKEMKRIRSTTSANQCTAIPKYLGAAPVNSKPPSFFLLNSPHVPSTPIRPHLFVQEFFAQPQPQEPGVHVFQPLGVRRLPLVVSCADEVLDLHLLEFPGPENEVPRGDFVPERFAYLRDPKGDFGPAHVAHVFEVDENALKKEKKRVDGREKLGEGKRSEGD